MQKATPVLAFLDRQGRMPVVVRRAERLPAVHRTYMGGLERGERNLSLRAVERIADNLKVDPLSLLVR
jgi:hypothetical protein